MKNPGFIRIIAAIIITVFALSFFVSGRRNIYMFLQYSSFNLGINLNNIASKGYTDWIKSQNNEYKATKSGIFLGEKVIIPESPGSLSSLSAVLGTNDAADDKWIEVDLSEQKLYMKEGTSTVGSFLVSTGKWAPTPKGEWRIWTKLRYTRMSGGSQALGTYYNLPNVPYTMYYNQGYGIHGAYWHNNFGNPMSHGCVNMKPEEAGIVFNWAQVGTRVVVHS